MENFNSFVAIDFETLQAVATDGMLYNHLPIQVGKAKMNILIPSNESMVKYGCPPKGKIAETLRKGKQIMNVNELKEILCTFDMYEGELE